MKRCDFIPDLLCPLCGENKAQHNGKKYIKMEHVPPRAIFVDRNDPHGLIKVPSCKNCNAGTSALDEQFKYQLSIYLGANTECQKALWQSARKTLNHPPNHNRRKAIIDNISTLLTHYRYGMGYLTMLDIAPIKTVAIKIVRGLHWYTTYEVLPPDVDLDIGLIEQGESIDKDTKIVFDKFGKSIQKCGDQFEAVYAIANDVKSASMWLLKFYGEDCLLCFIRPNQDDRDTSSVK